MAVVSRILKTGVALSLIAGLAACSSSDDGTTSTTATTSTADTAGALDTASFVDGSLQRA